MKIRRGRLDDVPALVELCKEYLSADALAAIPFSSQGVKGLLVSLISGGGVVVVADTDDGLVGYAVAAVIPFPFNPKITVISEISVYAKDPKVRDQLDKKAQQVGKQLGAMAVCSADIKVRAVA